MNQKKLDPKARSSILLSYLSNGNGYRVWDFDKQTVVKTRDVIFVDNVFPYSHVDVPVTIPAPPFEIDWPLAPSTDVVTSAPRMATFSSDRRLLASIHNPENALPPRLIPLPSDNYKDLLRLSRPSPDPSPPLPGVLPPGQLPCRSSRVIRVPTWYGAQAKSTTLSDMDTPKTWKQVLWSHNKDLWLKASNEELSSLLGMETWHLGPCPSKHRIIKLKWVFKPKHCTDGTISKLKARLVAMGYSQQKGVDFDDVFAPTTRFETLRLLCTLLGSKQWGGYQVDFKAAFLNGSLEHQIYMMQPPGYEDPDHPDYVCEVTGSLYGLKQLP